MPVLPYAATDQEAQARFAGTRSIDPLPSVPVALLNSADIIDYVIATGMLHPFRTEKGGVKKLKPASYEVDILGEVQYWDQKRSKWIKDIITQGKEFILARNSIAFVQVEPYFRLPDYIALRFNLKITHVYRGILLGTGPLVDPGFDGKLYIPLHNLTDNDYGVPRGSTGGAIRMSRAPCPWCPCAASMLVRYPTGLPRPVQAGQPPGHWVQSGHAARS